MNEEQMWKVSAKIPLTEIFLDEDSVPDEYYLKWLRDKYGDQCFRYSDEINNMPKDTPSQIMEWLEKSIEYLWETIVAPRKLAREKKNSEKENGDT